MRLVRPDLPVAMGTRVIQASWSHLARLVRQVCAHPVFVACVRVLRLVLLQASRGNGVTLERLVHVDSLALVESLVRLLPAHLCHPMHGHSSLVVLMLSFQDSLPCACLCQVAPDRLAMAALRALEDYPAPPAHRCCTLAALVMDCNSCFMC